MAASAKKKVHVEYHSSDSGSEADLESADEVSSDGDDSVDTGGNTGLANVMAKILQKKVADNKVILAKAKTDRELQKRKLEKEEEEDAKDGPPKSEAKKKKKKEETEEDDLPQHEKKKLWENMCRSKPDPTERERERRLQKVATRGVVQLFNAVRKQQKEVEDEVAKVGSSVRRKDLVMEGMTRDKFLNILQGTSTTNVKMDPAQKKEVSVKEEPAEDKNEKWGILRDDYMMGAKMKDWDKDSSDNDDDDDTGGPGDPELSDSD